jgi:hypothetical protein
MVSWTWGRANAEEEGRTHRRRAGAPRRGRWCTWRDRNRSAKAHELDSFPDAARASRPRPHQLPASHLMFVGSVRPLWVGAPRSVARRLVRHSDVTDSKKSADRSTCGNLVNLAGLQRGAVCSIIQESGRTLFELLVTG